MTQHIRFDDYAALGQIKARGFRDWGPPVTVGDDIVTGFEDIIGIQPDDGHIPGSLLLSLLPRLVQPNDWSMTGHTGAINLGCPSVRYPVQALIGATLHGRSRLAEAKPHPKGTLLAFEFEIQEAGVEQPCLQSTVELLYLGGKS